MPSTETQSSNQNSEHTATSSDKTLSSHSQAMHTKHMFSVEKPDVQPKEGEGIPRVHPFYLAFKEFVSRYDDRIPTLYHSFQASVQKFANSNILGNRPIVDGEAVGDYVWQSYSQVGERVHNIASGLAGFNLSPKSCIGIWSVNRPEWIITEQASYCRNFIVVPLFDTLAQEGVLHILDQTEMTVIFASAPRAESIFKTGVKSIKKIVLFDPITKELEKMASGCNVELICFKDLEWAGKNNPVPDETPLASDLSTICYTSGATGTPKGVELTHGAILACVSGALTVMARNPKYNELLKNQDEETSARCFVHLDENDVHLSYLPLAHIYERIVASAMIILGASIGFYQGDQNKLIDDAQALEPTIFLAVPRVCTRFYDKVQAKVSSSPLRKWLFNMAYESKKRALYNENTFKHWFWDRLIFNDIKHKLGTRVEKILSGSAPLSPEVLEFMRICFSCEVYEGYGQTETSAGSSTTAYGDWSVSGHVGAPLPCCEFKLLDIPEMSYHSTDKPYPRGEICIRGPSCFIGYYKDPEKTAETIDSEGWVHTGDIGRWDNQGRLYIIDRKKNIFKLAQGEYIAPEHIENVLLKCPYISQAFIYGDSLQNSLVAIVVPNSEALISWAKDHGLNSQDLRELCNDEQVKALYSKEIEKFGKTGTRDLSGFELPRAVYLEPDQFSIENGLMTSTLKCKRSDMQRKYNDIFTLLYQHARQQTSQKVTIISEQSN